MTLVHPFVSERAIDDVVARLPQTIYVARIPELLGVPMERVQAAIATGTLVTVGHGPRRRVVCAESREFFATEPGIARWVARTQRR